jgi:hypothetical protein|tara:strand:+ start:227 stop:556 length:330 start_codon:yes stop_codon:yes gene_type:complete
MEWEQVLKRKKIDFSVFKEALLREAGDVVVMNQGFTKKVLDEYIKLYRVKTGKSPSHGLARDKFEDRMQQVLIQNGGKVLTNNGYTKQRRDKTLSDGYRTKGVTYVRSE